MEVYGYQEVCDERAGARSTEARHRRRAADADHRHGRRRPGNVRTRGETAVDEAMGTGDNVH